MSNSLKKDMLYSFEEVISYLPSLFEEDTSFGLTDKEKYVKVVLSEKLPLKVKVGDRIPENTAVSDALKTGKIIVKDIPKGVYGIAFKSLAIPIFDENQVVGVLVVGKSLEKRHKIIEMSESLTNSLKQISIAVQEMTSEVQNIVDDSDNILNEINIANNNVGGSNEIISIIKGVSSQTNLLGLNASIESARAGEFGKGFSVVAGEIRKLSQSSNESVKKIEDILVNIKNSVETISYKISNTNKSVENQASTLEEITSAIEELTSASQYLEKFAKEY